MTNISRRNLLAAAAILPAASFMNIRISSADEAVDVDLQIGWLGGNGILGEIIGIKKGFFAEEGLNIEIIPGGPNVDGIASVAAGAADLGQYNSPTALILARASGIPVRAFAAGFQKHPFAFVSKSSNPVRTPKDLVGKRVAVQPTSLAILKALMKINDIAEGDIEIVSTGSDVGLLLTGQVDVISLWITSVGALKQIGSEGVEMMLWDTGVRQHANLYYATDAVFTEHRDLLEKFTRATARGWGYAKDHPEEAVDALVEAYPNLDRATELDAASVVLSLSFDDTTKRLGWGAMNPEIWAKQIETWASIGELKGTVPALEDVITFDILDATADVRRQVG